MTGAVTIVARQRECWDELAVRAYGSGHERDMKVLLEANPLLCVLPVFRGGEVVAVPPLPTPRRADPRPPWKR